MFSTGFKHVYFFPQILQRLSQLWRLLDVGPLDPSEDLFGLRRYEKNEKIQTFTLNDYPPEV